MVAMQPGRKLIVMRHAKAGELPGGPDAERALKTRGRRDAAAAGEWLRKHDYRPDAVICSAARRARQTWQCVAEQLGGQRPVSVDPRLYQAGAAELTGIVAGTPADVGTVMYVGHNPAAVELVAALTGEEVELPASAVAVIAVSGPWPELAPGAGQLVASWRPHPSLDGPGDEPVRGSGPG
jgi:phosphohistidine phosphatase